MKNDIMKNKMSKETMMKIGGGIAILVAIVLIVSSVMGGDSSAYAEENSTIDQSKKVQTNVDASQKTEDISVFINGNMTDNSKKINTGNISTKGDITF